MTQVLQAARSRLGGTVQAGGQDLGWKQVPSLNLLPAGRSVAISPLVVGLLVVLLAEFVVIQHLYRDLSSIDQKVVGATSEFDAAQGLLAVEEDAIADAEEKVSMLSDQAKGIEEHGNRLAQAQTELAGLRTDWASALEALLRVDGPDVTFTRVVAQPGGKLEATATLSEARALGIFLEHMRSVEDILVLLDYQKGLSQPEEGEPTQVLTVQVQVR